MRQIILLLFVLITCSVSDYRRLRCLVCRATVEEMTKQIAKVSLKKKIQVGGYRLDDSGNLQEKLVPYVRSGMHLSELMDNICDSMNDYVRATKKESKELVLIKLVNDEGTMNPEMSNVDIIQDTDLNKSIPFYCEGIVEEFEDEIYHELKDPSSQDPVNAICTKATEICDSAEKDEL